MEEMFPLDIRFREQYSVINLQPSVEKPQDEGTGEEVSMKVETTLLSEGYKINYE